jgi:hypothetical protein
LNSVELVDIVWHRNKKLYGSHTQNISNQLSDIHRHFVNLSTIVLLNVAQNTNIIVLYKVDGNTFAAKTSRATNSGKKTKSFRILSVSIKMFQRTDECTAHETQASRS